MKIGPLRTSGLLKGDIVEKIDDIEITNMSNLRKYVYTKNPGDKVVLTVKRKNSEFNIDVILGRK